MIYIYSIYPHSNITDIFNMEEELQKIEVLFKKELSEVRNKYKIIKKDIRSKYKIKKPKIKRKAIPKKIKNLVWNKIIGKEKGVGNCYCCDDDIDSKHFEVGHVVSVANGGKNNVDNLKPICSCCNKSMGKRNLELFKEEYMSKKTKIKPNNQQPDVFNAMMVDLLGPTADRNYERNQLRKNSSMFY